MIERINKFDICKSDCERIYIAYVCAHALRKLGDVPTSCTFYYYLRFRLR